MSDAESLSRTAAASRVAQLNSQTYEVATYGQHRQRVTSLILDARTRVLPRSENPSTGSSIAVLGAGNCRDLDLAVLMQSFSNLKLLDLDPQALDRGVAEQVDSKSAPGEIPFCLIQKLAPIDLASPLITLESRDVQDPPRCAQACQRLFSRWITPPTLPSSVVVSTCVLSQIIQTLIHLVSEQHPGFVPLLQAVRRGHLIRMLQLIEPGGQGVFISDVVSSETVPSLLTATDPELPGILTECLKTGNFFSGLNPASVIQDLKTVPELASECSEVTPHAPWVWTLGPRRYAVYAISFRRRG